MRRWRCWSSWACPRTTSCWRTTARPSRWCGAASMRPWRREPAARADFEASVAAHGRFQTQKALLAALAKRVEFALADAHGVVEASIKPFGEQFPEFARPARALRSAGAEGAAAATGRCRACARQGQRADLLGQGRGAGARVDRGRPAMRSLAGPADAEGRAAQVQRETRRPGAGSGRAGPGAAPGGGLRPARGLAAPPAHGAAGAAADRGIRRAQARARLGRHERRRARGAGDAVRSRCFRAGCRSGSMRASSTC